MDKSVIFMILGLCIMLASIVVPIVFVVMADANKKKESFQGYVGGNEGGGCSSGMCSLNF